MRLIFMSDINSIIIEDLGSFGAEMFNTKYPSYSGSKQEHAKSEGSSAVDFGGSNFAKFGHLEETPNTRGQANLRLGQSKDYADHEAYPKGGAGRAAILFQRS